MEPVFLRSEIQLGSQAGELIVGEPTNGDSISPRLAQALIDLVIDQVVAARRPNQYELKNKFIHDLLVGSIADDADVMREGHVLGMDFSRPRAVILVDASDYVLRGIDESCAEMDGEIVRRQTEVVIASIVSFFNLPDDTICGYVGNGEIAILKASTTQDLVDWTVADSGRKVPGASWANLAALKRAGAALLARLQCDTRASIGIAIGRYHPGIRGLSQSYHDAAMALSIGRRLGERNRVHCLDSLGVAGFVGVSDERTKVDLARHLISPLDDEPDLLRTLDVFFTENCSPSATAARLSTHRNTLAYRFDKIVKLIGLDPRCFDDAVQIRVALLLRRFHFDG